MKLETVGSKLGSFAGESGWIRRPKYEDDEDGRAENHAMGRRDEEAIDALLISPEFSVWRSLVAASFFDGQTIERTIAQVRDELRCRLTSLEDAARTEAETSVIAALLADASRDARVPEASGSATRPLSGSELDRKIVGDYPQPIARAYRALVIEESDSAAFGCLLDTFESLIHFLATVVLSAYLRSGLPNPEVNRVLSDLFLRRTAVVWSTGQLFALLCDSLRLAGDCDGNLPYLELVPFLFQPNGKPTASQRVLAGFVTLRNKAWGHRTGRTEHFFAQALPSQRALLEAELSRLHWLASYPLIRPTAITTSGLVNRAVRLMGDLKGREEACELPLEQGDLDTQGGDIRPQTSLLLLSRDGRTYLPLFPLDLYGVKPQGRQGVYLLSGCHWNRSARPRRLEKAVYVAYQEDLDDHEERANDFAARRLENLVARLESCTGPIELAASAEPLDDPDCSLEEVAIEQKFHLQSFVGREEALDDLTSWINDTTQGGYLVLLGPPGQGKSALMAALAERESTTERGGCLVHMIKSHRDPLRFIPALVGQAARLAKTRFGADAYRGELDDLRNTLVKALEAVRDRTGRALVVIDALDELVTDDVHRAYDRRIEFLPARLAEGVRIVLTCRPDIPLVQALRARLSGVKEKTLPPLSTDDFRRMLERRLEAGTLRRLLSTADFVAVFEHLGGNPLFLRAAVDRIAEEVVRASKEAREPRIFASDLPSTTEAFFRGIYRSIAEREGTRWTREEGRQKASLLKFLCLAREPLGFEELLGLMAAAGQSLSLEDCRDRLDEMSQYLLDTGKSRFKAWHQGLVDYVREQILGVAGIQVVEDTFCLWFSAAGLCRYALRHCCDHLLAASRWDDVVTLLTTPQFPEAKAEAGLVFELASDLAEAVRRLPTDHPSRGNLRLLGEALIRDVHFLARHPECLFQCLWNTAWWYGNAKAAHYYDSPRAHSGTEDGEHGSTSRLSDLLESWRAAKESKQPGFVWLRSVRPPAAQLGSSLLMVLHGHEGGVASVGFLPDGRRIASGSSDKSVRIWDCASGEQLLRLTGHEGAVASLALSPDGRRIASGSADKSVRIWDAASGESLLQLKGHEDTVWSVSFSSDGRRLASGAKDGTVRLWDTVTGNELSCLSGHANAVTSVAFTGMDRFVISGSNDKTVRVWDTDAGAATTFQPGPGFAVNCMAIAPAEGRILFSGWNSRTIRICDLRSGAHLASLRGHKDFVTSVAVSPDGRWIASASWDKTVRVWDARSGTQLACFRGHDQVVWSVAFSPDGLRLVSGSKDRTLRVWDAEPSSELFRIRGHTDRIRLLAFSSDGRQLASGSSDLSVRIWEPSTGILRLVLLGHVNEIDEMAFSPDNRRLASVAKDRTLRIWDLVNGSQLACLGEIPVPAEILAFDRTGDRLVIKSANNGIQIWDVKSRKCLEEVTGWIQPQALVAQRNFILCKANAYGNKQARAQGFETVIHGTSHGVPPLAWFPAALDNLVAHPSGRIWAGSVSSHLYLIKLEGDLPSRVKRPK